MGKGKGWIVATSGDRPIREIAKDLADAGLAVGQVLEEIGSITGSADAKVVAKLRKVRGVVDVSPDTPIDIGPPGGRETW